MAIESGAPEVLTFSDEYYLMRWAHSHPVDWIQDCLGADLTDYQAEAVYSVRDNRKTAIGSCHSAGKSGLAGFIATWYLNAYYGAVVITTAPTYRQVRNIIWDRIRACKSRARIPLGGTIQSTGWRKDDGWYAAGITAPPHDTDKFQGIHSESGHLLCIVDEAAGVSQNLYDGGIQPIIVGENDRLFLIGNTTSTQGEFRAAAHVPRLGYNYIQVSAFQTPNFTETGITLEDIASGEWKNKLKIWQGANPGRTLPRPYLISPAWVADRANAWGIDSILFKSRICAIFVDEGSSTLISPALVDVACEQWRALRDAGQLSPREGRAGYAGLDVAAEGADASCLGILEPAPLRESDSKSRKGRKVFAFRELFHLPSNDIPTLESLTRQKLSELPSQPAGLAIDATGLGQGIADSFRNNPPTRPVSFGDPLKTRVIRFKGGAGCPDKENREQFPNIRSEAGWRLREAFEARQIAIDPSQEELIREMTTLQWRADKGKYTFALEPKDQYKKRTGQDSPDRLDTLMMANWSRHRGGRSLVFS